MEDLGLSTYKSLTDMPAFSQQQQQQQDATGTEEGGAATAGNKAAPTEVGTAAWLIVHMCNCGLDLSLSACTCVFVRVRVCVCVCLCDVCDSWCATCHSVVYCSADKVH